MSRIEIDYLLYAIVDLSVVPLAGVVPLAQAAVRGGVTVVQLRGKQTAAGRLHDLARELKGVLSVPLIINDRIDVAALSGADGVHLGDEDLELGEAAQQLPGALLGRTARTPAAAAAAVAEGAHYLGVGAVFASSTKTDVPVIGPAGLAAVVAAVDRPVVAIGGIDLERIEPCMTAGAAGVAIVSGLFGGHPTNDQVEDRARRFRETLERYRRPSES